MLHQKTTVGGSDNSNECSTIRHNSFPHTDAEGEPFPFFTIRICEAMNDLEDDTVRAARVGRAAALSRGILSINRETGHNVVSSVYREDVPPINNNPNSESDDKPRPADFTLQRNSEIQLSIWNGRVWSPFSEVGGFGSDYRSFSGDGRWLAVRRLQPNTVFVYDIS